MSAESQDPLSWLLEKLLELLRGGESKYGGVPVAGLPPELMNLAQEVLSTYKNAQTGNAPQNQPQNGIKPHPLLNQSQQFDGAADNSRRSKLNDNPNLVNNDTAQQEFDLRKTPAPRPGPAVTPELKPGK